MFYVNGKIHYNSLSIPFKEAVSERCGNKSADHLVLWSIDCGYTHRITGVHTFLIKYITVPNCKKTSFSLPGNICICAGIFQTAFGNFYGSNGVCFPLHIHDPWMLGWQYSALVFVGINFLAMILICFCYAAMFISIQVCFGK